MGDEYESEESPPLNFGGTSQETAQERKKRELEAAKANRQVPLTLEERVAALEAQAGLSSFRDSDEG